jgi:hypothetical protein
MSYNHSTPLKTKSLQEEQESKEFSIYSFLSRNQNLSIFIYVIVVAIVAVLVSIIFTQYKANPCSPFSRVIIEKSVFSGKTYYYLTNLTTKVERE